MKVRIKDADFIAGEMGISVGDEFYVFCETKSMYCVCLNDGHAWFTKDRFEVVEEESLEELNVPSPSVYINFLPTKVIFNEAKGKTTLLFGHAPYGVVTSVASHGDTFEHAMGFIISMVKRFYKNHKQLFNMAYGLGDNGFLTGYLEGLIDNKFLEYGMSVSQITKLKVWCFDKPLKFLINGVEHTIEVEHK